MVADERIFDFDDYKPAQIARNVEIAGNAKAELRLLPLAVLAILAGFFIALGAALYTLVVTGSPLGFGPTRLLGGMAFSLGLILVVVGGAELFTGNNLHGLGSGEHHGGRGRAKLARFLPRQRSRRAHCRCTRGAIRRACTRRHARYCG